MIDTTSLLQRWSFLVCLVAITSTADAAEWHVDRKATNNVTFTSEVVTFSFEGTNDKVDGFLYWEGPGLFEGKPQLLFQVEVNAFDTGIGKRDSDMRDVLKADKHPLSTYKGTIIGHEAITDSSGVPTGQQHVRTRGTLSLAGVERSVGIDGIVAVGDSTATLQAEFNFRLAEFDIEAPGLAAFVKVSEQIDIAVDLSLKRVK
jgi:polyisoprenoid-binding protein YceI